MKGSHNAKAFKTQYDVFFISYNLYKIVIDYYSQLVYKYNIELHSITVDTTNTMSCSVRLHYSAIYITCLGNILY
jgi:hypothetical protein